MASSLDKKSHKDYSQAHVHGDPKLILQENVKSNLPIGTVVYLDKDENKYKLALSTASNVRKSWVQGLVWSFVGKDKFYLRAAPGPMQYRFPLTKDYFLDDLKTPNPELIPGEFGDILWLSETVEGRFQTNRPATSSPNLIIGYKTNYGFLYQPKFIECCDGPPPPPPPPDSSSSSSGSSSSGSSSSGSSSSGSSSSGSSSSGSSSSGSSSSGSSSSGVDSSSSSEPIEKQCCFVILSCQYDKNTCNWGEPFYINNFCGFGVETDWIKQANDCFGTKTVCIDQCFDSEECDTASADGSPALTAGIAAAGKPEWTPTNPLCVCESSSSSSSSCCALYKWVADWDYTTCVWEVELFGYDEGSCGSGNPEGWTDACPHFEQYIEKECDNFEKPAAPDDICSDCSSSSSSSEPPPPSSSSSDPYENDCIYAIQTEYEPCTGLWQTATISYMGCPSVVGVVDWLYFGCSAIKRVKSGTRCDGSNYNCTTPDAEYPSNPPPNCDCSSSSSSYAVTCVWKYTASYDCNSNTWTYGTPSQTVCGEDIENPPVAMNTWIVDTGPCDYVQYRNSYGPECAGSGCPDPGSVGTPTTPPPGCCPSSSSSTMTSYCWYFYSAEYTCGSGWSQGTPNSTCDTENYTEVDWTNDSEASPCSAYKVVKGPACTTGSECTAPSVPDPTIDPLPSCCPSSSSSSSSPTFTNTAYIEWSDVYDCVSGEWSDPQLNNLICYDSGDAVTSNGWYIDENFTYKGNGRCEIVVVSSVAIPTNNCQDIFENRHLYKPELPSAEELAGACARNCFDDCPSTVIQNSITLNGDWGSSPCSCGLNGTYTYIGYNMDMGDWFWDVNGEFAYVTDLGGGMYGFNTWLQCGTIDYGMYYGEGALTCDDLGRLVGTINISWNGSPDDGCAGTTGTVTFGP